MYVVAKAELMTASFVPKCMLKLETCNQIWQISKFSAAPGLWVGGFVLFYYHFPSYYQLCELKTDNKLRDRRWPSISWRQRTWPCYFPGFLGFLVLPKAKRRRTKLIMVTPAPDRYTFAR